MKKVIAFFLIGIMLCSNFHVFADNEKLPFMDIDDVPWAHEAIAYFYFSAPYSAQVPHPTYYLPHIKLERDEAVFSLITLTGLPSHAESDANFNDVSGQYSNEIGIAKKLNIVLGDGNNNFYPKRNITREEFAVVVYRAMISLDAEFDGNSSVSPFQDADISDYAKEAITKLHECGIINGNGDGYFLPKKELEKAELYKMIYEAMKYMGLLKEIGTNQADDSDGC